MPHTTPILSSRAEDFRFAMMMCKTMFVAIFAAILAGNNAAPKRRQKIDLVLTVDFKHLGKKHGRTGSPKTVQNQVITKEELNKERRVNSPANITSKALARKRYSEYDIAMVYESAETKITTTKSMPDKKTDAVFYNTDLLTEEDGYKDYHNKPNELYKEWSGDDTIYTNPIGLDHTRSSKYYANNISSTTPRTTTEGIPHETSFAEYCSKIHENS